MVEFDVRRTRDEQLVLVHDERIRGVRVGQLDYADLATRIGGGEPPRLEEALELIAGRIDADVELKEDGCVEAAVAALRGRLEPARFRLTSFLDSALLAARRVAPELNTGLLLGPPGPVELARQRIGPQAGLALGASRWSGGLELRVREARGGGRGPSAGRPSGDWRASSGRSTTRARCARCWPTSVSRR
jgi:hypothetical protein